MTNNLKHIIMPDGTKLDLPTGSTGGSAKIGDIGFVPYVDETTNERKRLNGQVLIKDQYPAFVTWLTSLQATTPSLFATEDEWQSIKTASKLGQCGKFVIGDTTIRLPQVVNINGLVDMSNAGLIKDESLPNFEIVSKTSSAVQGGTAPAKTKLTTISQPYGINTSSTYYGQTSPAGMIIEGSSLNQGTSFIPDSSTYKDNAPVQQEAIQYPYYITVNTGSENTKPTINDYTVTTAYQYGMSQYYKGIMNSGTWLRSNGQMNPKATYEGLYNWALTQLNAGVEGFKSSTVSDITDYDFVINQTNETFRLPLIGERVLVESKNPTNDDKTWYNLYSDGWCEQGGYNSGQDQTISLLKEYNDTNYYINVMPKATNSGYNSYYETCFSNVTTTSFYIAHQNASGGAGSVLGFNWKTCGYINLSTITSKYNLYFYCGNVEENPQLVNVARIEEALVDKTSMAQASIASIPSNKYDNLTLLASEQPYVAPENGYFYLSKAGSSGQYISILNKATGISLYSEKTNYSSPCVLYRVKKGDEVTITYTTTGVTNYFRFYYDIGASSSVSPDKVVANHLDTINGEVV